MSPSVHDGEKKSARGFQNIAIPGYHPDACSRRYEVLRTWSKKQKRVASQQDHLVMYNPVNLLGVLRSKGVPGMDHPCRGLAAVESAKYSLRRTSTKVRMGQCPSSKRRRPLEPRYPVPLSQTLLSRNCRLLPALITALLRLADVPGTTARIPESPIPSQHLISRTQRPGVPLPVSFPLPPLMRVSGSFAVTTHSVSIPPSIFFPSSIGTSQRCCRRPLPSLANFVVSRFSLSSFALIWVSASTIPRPAPPASTVQGGGCALRSVVCTTRVPSPPALFSTSSSPLHLSIYRCVSLRLIPSDFGRRSHPDHQVFLVVAYLLGAVFLLVPLLADHIHFCRN